MNMKKLIESMDHIEECGMAEGPMGMAPPMSPPAPEMDKGNPVTVNVSRRNDVTAYGYGTIVRHYG